MLTRIVLFLVVAFFASSAVAQTYVNGYTRKNGTYVAPHVRSSPNSTRSDNYGSAPRVRSAYQSSYSQPARLSNPYAPAPRQQATYGNSYSSPYTRDKDNDGISNTNDQDDDNDGISDDNDPNP